MGRFKSRRKAVQFVVGRTVSYTLLVAVGVAMLVPFFWQAATSVKPRAEAQDFTFIPSVFKWNNYVEVFEDINYGRYYFNSLFVAAWVTVGQVFTSAMAAYAFSRIRWPGRDKVFLLYLATLMIPGVVTMIPNFIVLRQLKMVDTYWALILPGMFSAYGTFMLRQFMLTIPAALEEAAEIDGCNPIGIFRHVILPLARPGMVTLGILTFMGNWQSFTWPLIITYSDHLKTLPVGLNYFNSLYSDDFVLLMAGTMMAMVPAIIVFVVGQRFFVRGIQLGAVKG